MPSVYIPALRFKALTRFYDPLVQFTTREREFKQALMEAANAPDDATVVDIGCGTGTLAIGLKQRHPEARIVGLDADASILQRARDKAEQAGADIEFVKGDATALPFDDGFADRVVSSLFFHHLERNAKNKAFLEVMRVLKPDGEFHVADWGAPQNGLMRALFFPVRLLDGFAPTDDNVNGRLAKMIEQAGADQVTETTAFATVFGTIRLIKSTKNAYVLGA